MDNLKINQYVIFLVDKEKDSTGQYKEDGKLRMRVRWGKNIIAFSVGYRVKLTQWDTNTQRCRAKTTNLKAQSASIINAEIQRLETIINNVFTAFELQNINCPTPNEVRDTFNLAVGRDNGVSVEVASKTFFSYIDEFTRDIGKKNNWTTATYQKFDAMKSHITNFAPDVTFEDFSEQGLTQYVDYLNNVTLSDKDNIKQIGMRNTTIGKQLGFLKWFLRWATAKGYNTQNAYLTFTPKLKTSEKKVIFLDWDELMKMYNYVAPENKNYLARVRDVFCFCCFTSLRYSDVANLKRSDVFDSYISITTVKTADSLRIELNNYSQSILSKYENETFDNNLALPVISNQRMNEYLKELGELCGIDKSVTVTYYKGNRRIDEVYPKYKLLGTHAGRRTFICNALMMGISPQVVMKWTGHSDYKAMKPYIDIADSAKVDAMKLFNR